jgi:hypothetical protein
LITSAAESASEEYPHNAGLCAQICRGNHRKKQTGEDKR